MPSSAPPRRFEAKDLDEKSRPWMFEVPYTIVVFEWAVLNSSVSPPFINPLRCMQLSRACTVQVLSIPPLADPKLQNSPR